MRILGPKVTRMSGAGNTFFFIETFKQKMTLDRADLARRLCQDTPGLHADGFVVIEPPTPQVASAPDFRWDFYNEDGSPAEMCGNAARCAALYFHTVLGGPKDLSFQTVAGLVTAKILSFSRVEVILPKLKKGGELRTIITQDGPEEFFCINTGVPHVIVEGDPDPELAAEMREASEFEPAGTNVTFVGDRSESELRAVTYERGVEDFTLACGTGAVAAAAFGRKRHPQIKSFNVEMPGGELIVQWLDDLTAVLTGPVRFEFDLWMDEEAKPT